MIEFINEVEVHLTPREVFEFIADFENAPKWNYFVTDVKKRSSGPIGVGTVFDQTRKTDGQSYQITDLIPDRRVEVATTPGSTPAFTMRYDFESTPDGTRLTDHWRLQSGHNPLFERLGERRIRAAVAENLGKLKQLLETGTTTLQDGRTTTR